MRFRPGAFALVITAIVLAGCTGTSSEGSPTTDTSQTPPLPSGGGRCGAFSIAYDPTNGYEASAFVVGSLAEDELGCDVTYVKTTSSRAWRVVADGKADVYLDAYGRPALEAKLTRPGGPVVRLGPTGFKGGVDLLAPAFMGDLGLKTYRDLSDTESIGWGQVTPAITTVPALLPLARSFVESRRLGYTVRDYSQVGVGVGMRDLLQQARLDNEAARPNLYLVEGPRELIGDGPGRTSVEIPGSAADNCVLNRVATLCSLSNFHYQKIANSAFAESDSPAYNLVYRYQLDRDEVDNLLEIVQLSGYRVTGADVASWINTHPNVWKRGGG
ncbi:MAG: glycine betaine ABC transporter substrate-binding protein, partial [Nocardioidaceae bacterium]